MCGIVGYSGPENPKDVILSGLKTLEYRGYDSAGVSIFHSGYLKRVRAEGKLSELESKLTSESFDGHIGIGHTRWATHGPPIEINAHPHAVAGVNIVHNGIIENYAVLRDELMASGAEISSDTDSEMVAHLISREVESGKSLFDSVKSILPRLEGAFSILAVSEKEPNELVAFKNGPPLIVGIADDAVIVASDILAIVPYTKDVIYLEDFQIARVSGTSCEIFDSLGSPLSVDPIKVDWTEDRVEKAGYAHYMLKEIYEQPRAVAAAIDPHIDLEKKCVSMGDIGLSEDDLRRCERIFIVACGTSFYAGMVGEYLLEHMAGVPVEVDVASEFRYRQQVIPKNSLVITISQSGETADTLAALRLVKETEAMTLSICNVKNSTIDREADGHIYMNAGTEIGVASTKAMACTLAIFNVFAIFMAKIREKIAPKKEQEYVESLIAAPSLMENVLAYDKFFAEAADTLKKYKGFLYMGRGISYPIAMEGALKLKELAYMHAEGYAAGEMKHGPLALIDKSMAVVMLAPKDVLYDKTISNLEEAKARGGQIISIGTGEDEKLKRLSLHYLAVPKTKWLVNPLVELIPLQLLAYHVAHALGHDVDQPRNLAKSVTVE